MGCGITNQFVITQDKNFSINNSFKNEYGNSFPFYHLGFIGTIGSKYMLKNNHNVFLEFNYEITQNIKVNGRVDYKLTNNIFSFVAGYTL
jgi:hypothetical protein